MRTESKLELQRLKRRRAVLVGAILLVGLAVLLAACNMPAPILATEQAAATEGQGQAAAVAGAGMEVAPIGEPYVVTLEQARAMLPFAFRVPSVPPAGGELVAVEVALPNDPRAVSLRYSNGIKINIGVPGGCPNGGDRSAQIRWVQEWVQESSAAQPDGVFRLTDVRGIPAGGADPGTNYSAIARRTFPRPGVVFWCEGPVMYEVYGDLPMAALRQIAETMAP